MQRPDKLKNIVSLLLVTVMIFSLCSCRSKSDDEITTTSGTTTAYIPAAETGESVSSTQPEQTTTAPDLTTANADCYQKTTFPRQTTEKTSAVTKTEKEAPSEPAEISGIETVTDGSKTIVYPSALKTSHKRCPVIAWANGTGCPTRSYTALLEMLAQGGYIVIADADVMTNDGKSQIDSIDYIIKKSRDPSSVFYNKADTSKIGACGHSQGGRSSVNAAQADTRIRCVVSIAGASNADEARGLAVPCLFLTGTHDLIVVSSLWCKPSYDAVAGRAAYASLKSGVHTTCMISPQKVSGYAIDWFDAYLKNDPNAKKVFEDGGKLANDSAWKDFQNK